MPDPSWQTLCQAALAESDPTKLNARIEAARRSIHQRLEETEDSRDAGERQLLNNTLYALQTLLARKRCA
jgi:hypothetical protein